MFVLVVCNLAIITLQFYIQDFFFLMGWPGEWREISSVKSEILFFFGCNYPKLSIREELLPKVGYFSKNFFKKWNKFIESKSLEEYVPGLYKVLEELKRLFMLLTHYITLMSSDPVD